jgi:hypothetical protein
MLLTVFPLCAQPPAGAAYSYKAAALSQRVEHIVAGGVALSDGRRTAVAVIEGSVAGLYRLQRRPVRCVPHVQEHLQPVHPLDRVVAEVGEPQVLVALTHASAQHVTLAIADTQTPHPKPV